MTSSEFLGGDNAFHYTWEKRKVTSVLCYLRKAFKGRGWSVCLEGKGPDSNCIRSLLPPWNASNDTTIFSSVIVYWPIRFAKDDVIYRTKFPLFRSKMSDAVVNSSGLSTDDARDNSPCYLWATDGYSESTCIPEGWDVRVTPDHKVYFIE